MKDLRTHLSTSLNQGSLEGPTSLSRGTDNAEGKLSGLIWLPLFSQEHLPLHSFWHGLFRCPKLIERERVATESISYDQKAEGFGELIYLKAGGLYFMQHTLHHD